MFLLCQIKHLLLITKMHLFRWISNLFAMYIIFYPKSIISKGVQNIKIDMFTQKWNRNGITITSLFLSMVKSDTNKTTTIDGSPCTVPISFNSEILNDKETERNWKKWWKATQHIEWFIAGLHLNDFNKWILGFRQNSFYKP